MMFCPDCDTNLDDVPPEDPCPGCGGRRRSATVTAVVARVAAATHRVAAWAIDATRDSGQRVLTVLLALTALFDPLVLAYAGLVAATVTAVLAVVGIVWALRRAPSHRALDRALTWVSNPRP
jgi:hypothetical protein